MKAALRSPTANGAKGPARTEFRRRVTACGPHFRKWAAPWPAPVAPVLGSEGSGWPDALLAAGDLQLRMPMTGTAESLNLAVAVGVLLYEPWRHQSH